MAKSQKTICIEHITGMIDPLEPQMPVQPQQTALQQAGDILKAKIAETNQPKAG